ncbi:hypothetical protein K2X85_09660 [bacterium]|jgi:hypothetical protein|nr:hypothetical protein [bacterium]
MDCFRHLIAIAVFGMGIMFIPEDFACRSCCLAEPGQGVRDNRTVSIEHLGPKLGWYRVSGGDEVLVTWGEEGELKLLRPKYSEQVRLIPRTPFLFEVIDRQGNSDGTVSFGLRASRESGGFHWLHTSTLSTIGMRDHREIATARLPRLTLIDAASSPVY